MWSALLVVVHVAREDSTDGEEIIRIAKRQQAVLERAAKHQSAEDDSRIDFSDIPELTDTQLRNARRAPKVLVAARIDRDVFEWLQGYGEGYSTRINAILRAVMSDRWRSG